MSCIVNVYVCFGKRKRNHNKLIDKCKTHKKKNQTTTVFKTLDKKQQIGINAHRSNTMEKKFSYDKHYQNIPTIIAVMGPGNDINK